MFGQVIQGYVNNHPPDEVVPVIPAEDLGWPDRDPDQDDSDPAGSLADVPLVPNAATNPGGKGAGLRRRRAGRGRAARAQRPARHDLPGGQQDPATLVWWRRDRRPRLVGPPAAAGTRRAVAGLENPKGTLEPAVTLVGGFENSDHSFWGRPVNAAPGPHGARYVSDDTAGAIYRLAPAS